MTSLSTGNTPPPHDEELQKEAQERGIDLGDHEKAAQAIANGISCNEHFCAFLLTIKAEGRKSAYDAIAPKLRFKPRPYIMLMAQKAKVLRTMKQRLGFRPR